jgi:hypothetical protein
LLEKDAAAVAKLLFVRLINKGLKIVVCHRAFFQSALTCSRLGLLRELKSPLFPTCSRPGPIRLLLYNSAT